MRTPHGQYPEYHTSADDMSLILPDSLADSFARCLRIVDMLEKNKTYVSLNQKCEPQLGSRGLYPLLGTGAGVEEPALLWVLNLSDGLHHLLDIAERSGCTFSAVERAASTLLEHGLLVEHRP
jgi:aminopeptidase-like protein